jgi:hypothetical protein
MPAIVIRDHGDGGVAKLRFARQLGFGDVGHADDLEAQLPVYVRLRQRGKLRAFDAHVGAAPMHLHAGMHAGVRQHRGNLRARWFIEAHVRHQAAAEESRDPALCSVKELVRNKKLAGPQIFLQRAHRAHGNDALHAQLFHRADIRAKIDFAGQNAVPAAVPRKKSDALPFQCAEHDGVRRVAERRFHTHFARVAEPAHRAQPAAPDNSNRRSRCLSLVFLFASPRRHSSLR